MEKESYTYPALYVIFTITQAIRRKIPRNLIWREFRRQHIQLHPRLSFWIAICKQLGVIRQFDAELRLTSYAKAWLNKSVEKQTHDLIEAWQKAPKNKKARQFRKKLFWKLKYNQPLTAKDHTAFNGLNALGITADGVLTKWGKIFIKEEGTLPTQPPRPPCRVEKDTFIAPLHFYPELLWQIETYLRPSQPGIYPLHKKYILNGDPKQLIDLIEKGLQSNLPDRLKATLLGQPSIRVSEGIILEFSNPAELKQLRRQPTLRKYIHEYLSPQRILISKENEKALIRLLKRRGIYLHPNEDQTPVKKKKRTHFQQTTLLQPSGKNIPKLALIQKYLTLEQALDISYRSPGCNPEKRRITPLSIEQRGEYTYIIAYCQTRRGQRTFRLDRMEIPGAW